jgi:hypothetical protein
MLTRNGRIAVSLFSAAVGVDESAGDVTVAMAMTPILMAWISCSNRFMRPPSSSIRPDMGSWIHQTKVSTIPFYYGGPWGVARIRPVASV